VAAVSTLSGGVVFKKLHRLFALRALDIENGTWFPVLRVLAGAFHIRRLLPCVVIEFAAGLLHPLSAAVLIFETSISGSNPKRLDLNQLSHN
jgi:hypothetical protein